MVSVYAQCPFYQEEERQKIFCEGVQEGSRLTISFGNVEDKREYCGKWCKGDWARCLVADMLCRKWEYLV